MAKKDSRLQIPISSEKKSLLDVKSEELGFSSSTDAVRFLINNFLKGSINVSINSGIKTLDKQTEKDILESIKEIEQGKVLELDPRDANFHKKLLKFADE